MSRTPIAFEKRDVRPLNDEARTVWSLSEDVSDSPSCRSDQRLGVAIFPQRGVDAGSDWGYSNVLRV